MNLDQQLNELFPASEATPEMSAAIARGIGEKVSRNRRRASVRRGRFALAGTAVLVAGGIFVGPTAYAVVRLNQLAESVSDVDTAIFDYYGVQADGSRLLNRRMFYDRGLWRTEEGDRFTIFRDGKLWIYSPDLNRVTMKHSPDGPFAHNPSGFSVKAMLSDMARWNWDQKITFGSAQFEGRKVEAITITDSSDRERSIVYADPQTNMPLAMRQEGKSITGWQLRSEIELVFNQPISQELFALDFPEGAQVVDLEKAQREFYASLERPLTEFKLGEKLIQIRALRINPRGHVFILFTDGETVQQREEYAKRVKDRDLDFEWHVPPGFEIRDSNGEAFTSSGSSLQPYVTGGPQGGEGPVTTDGQVMQGSWLVGSETEKWIPRKLEVVCSDGRGNKHSWKVSFADPTDPVYPDWMSLLAIAPRNEKNIFAEERRLARERYASAGDWGKVAEVLKNDLDAVREEEIKGATYAKGDTYYRLYEALSKSGERQEALQYLELAAKEPLYPNQYPEREIKEAMNREGMARP